MTVFVDSDVAVEHEGWNSYLENCETFIHSIAQDVFRDLTEYPAEPALNLVSFPHRNGKIEIAVLLADDATLQELNRNWRGKDQPTNVLSFPSSDPVILPDESVFLGDLALSFNTVEREAREQDKTFQQHTAHLIIHGILHLLGYDHETDQDAEYMEKREIAILARMNLPDPYADHDAAVQTESNEIKAANNE
jgi:metalloprotein, YbeY/UPF0054 family